MILAKQLIVPMILATVLSLLTPNLVAAQSRVSLKLSPTSIEDKVDPGTERSLILNVTNEGESTVELYPLAQNITGIGPDLRPIYDPKPDREGYTLASWITYQESELIVRPGEQRSLHFTVRFPKDAHPGSHMAGIFLSDKPKDAQVTGSSIGFQVGSILNFPVAGEIEEETEIREFYTDKSVYSAPTVGFTVKLENMGNVLSRPHGLVDITNMWGKKVASIPVNESGAGIFPKGTREFSSVWESDDVQLGRFEAVIALAVEGSKGTQTISRVVQFWVLPMNIIGPLFGGLLFLIVLVYIIIRLYVRSQLAGISRQARSRKEASGLSRSAAVVIALLVAIIIGLALLFFYFG